MSRAAWMPAMPAPMIEAGRIHVDFLDVQGFQPARLDDGALHQALGLLVGGGVVFVHPGALLADVGHLQEVGVEPHAREGLPEGELVHTG